LQNRSELFIYFIVKAPGSSIGEKAAAYFDTNIMKSKKKFGMGLKGRKKVMKN